MKKRIEFVLLLEVYVDFYYSEEDMYRDEEEIEREKILLCETNSSGTIELCVKFQMCCNSL